MKMSTEMQDRKSLIISLGDKLSKTDKDKNAFHRVAEELYSNEALTLISDACGADAERDEFIWRMTMMGTSEDNALDCIDLLPVIEEIPDLDSADAVMFVSEMAGYEFLPARDDDLESRREQAAALLVTAVAIHTDVRINPSNLSRYKVGHSEELHSVEENLARLVAARPDRVHEILDIMKDRKTSDAESIRSVLDHDVRALGGGFL